MLFMMLFTMTAQTAWADTGNVADGVYYMDANGTLKNTATDGIDGNDTPTVLTGSETTLGAKDTETWYVVDHDISYTKFITCLGVVTIILCDNCTMNIGTPEKYLDDLGLGAIQGGDLTIYGQRRDETDNTEGHTVGRLNSYSKTARNLYAGDYIQHSGVVNLFGDRNVLASFTLNGGKFTVNADTSDEALWTTGLSHKSFTVNGGQLEVTNTNSKGCAISAIGDISLRWTRTTDYIKADNYQTRDQYEGPNPPIYVRSGHAFITDDATPQAVYGTISDISLINGKKLTPYEAFTANGDTYTICDATGWNLFCDQMEAGNSFSGKTVKLTDDFDNTSEPINRMAGDADHKFCGTFDGNGRTLTLNLSATSEGCAPFSHVQGATIQDLNIAGKISTTSKYAASIAVHTYGTTSITNCHSTVEITCTLGTWGADGTNGGFVAVNEDEGTLSFTDCYFKGKFLGNAGYNGGFVGYVCSNSSVSYTDCLFAPTEIGMSGTGSCTFNRNGHNSLTRAFYVTAFGEAQGALAFSALPDNYICETLTATDTQSYYVPLRIDMKTSYFERDNNIHPEPTLTRNDGTVLTKGVHYSVAYGAEDDGAAGDYMVIVTSISPYSGSQNVSYQVKAADVIEGLAFDPYDECYNIPDAAAFNTLCTYVNDGHNCAGKTFRQTGDIYLNNNFTPMSTSGSDGFKGTYNGAGHTMELNLTAESDNCAPFGYVYNGSIKNLNITGTITSSAKYAASLVAKCYNLTVLNCHSTVDIISTFQTPGTDATHGGFLAVLETDGSVYFQDCSFKGRFLGENATSCGGFVGWANENNGWGGHTTIRLTDCLFAPAQMTVSTDKCATFYRTSNSSYKAEGHFNHAYFTEPLGSVQGTQVYSTAPNESDYEPVTAADGNTYYILTEIKGLTYDKLGHYYIISSTSALNALAEYVNSDHNCAGKTFKLTADITYTHTTDWDDADSQENNFTRIGTGPIAFSGVFDGQGHTISGIRIYSSASCQGLFGCINDGTVRNVILNDARITGTYFVGGIMGCNSGTIKNCHVTANVLIGSMGDSPICHGAIAGQNQGTVDGCTSSATLSQASSCGGIVGDNYNEDNVVKNCLATHVIIYGHTFVGAIVGKNNDGTLSHNYYSYCTVDGETSSIGCGAKGDITANDGAVEATILSDAESVPTDMSGKVAFRREFKGGKASTVIFPFEYEKGTEGTYYTFSGVSYDSNDGKWKATMTEYTGATLAANTPYLFMPAGTDGIVPVLFYGAAAASISAGTTTQGDWQFKGVYEKKTWAAADCGRDYGFAATSGKATDGVTDVDAGDFVKFAAGASLRPMRSYLTYTGSDNPWATTNAPGHRAGTELPQSISVVLVSATGETTEITTTNFTFATPHSQRENYTNSDAWYTLDGRKIANGKKPTAKGLYIHNGRKVVIK